MKIIFFDGYCGLCNGFVDFIIKFDKNAVFKFSPLQSEFAKTKLSQSDLKDLKSVVVLINDQTYRKAEAALKALAELGWPWKILLIFSLLPEKVLNFFYDLIAANRYRIFGKRETCRLPTPEERERFIL
jgi:predicted DCC family thiol-disulfide oxidoreductase YuxK